MRLKANAVRLQLHALAYNLANFLRTLATPEEFERWSLTSLRERLTKTGVRLVRHGRYAIFQMAEAAVPRRVFAAILSMINALRGPPPSGALA
jgi:hypothetical protein